MSVCYSVNKLNKISKKREIWCWGTGFRYGRMINNYENEIFVDKIAGLIDTNPIVQGTNRTINGRNVRIYSPDNSIKDKNKKYILVISCDAYDAVCSQASGLFKDLDIIYTSYPRNYYDFSKYIMSLFCKFPLKRQLLFYVGTGTSQPHENATEIVRYLKEEYTGVPYKIVYLTDAKDETLDNITQISLATARYKTNFFELLKYYFYYCTSSYLMYENGPIGKVRSDQKSIYLNHGTIPLKYVKDALKQPTGLNYAICPGEGCRKFYEEQYAVPKEKQILMMIPRVREIYIDKGACIDTIFDTIDKKLILWLPTFRCLERGDRSLRKDSMENPVINLINSDDAEVVDECLKRNNQKLILKCHPREKDAIKVKEGLSNILIITDELLNNYGVNTHNLMNRADSLISDYSGVTFEYFLLDKPTGYYIPDIEKYTRGFSVEDPFQYMPGNKIYTIDQFVNYLDGLNNGKDEYKAERQKLVEELFGDVNPKTGAKDFISFLDKNII